MQVQAVETRLSLPATRALILNRRVTISISQLLPRTHRRSFYFVHGMPSAEAELSALPCMIVANASVLLVPTAKKICWLAIGRQEIIVNSSMRRWILRSVAKG